MNHVSRILCEEDIEGLIQLGAPDDEYESEARDIASAIERLPTQRRTVESVASIIALIWTKSFNCSDKELEQRIISIRRVAERIVANEMES